MKKKWSRKAALLLAAVTILTSLPTEYLYADVYKRQRGTSSLALFYYWLIQMKEASFVFIDEFDAFYHDTLAEQVVRELLAMEHTQALFTTCLLYTSETYMIQELHLPVYHCWCLMLEEHFFG